MRVSNYWRLGRISRVITLGVLMLGVVAVAFAGAHRPDHGRLVSLKEAEALYGASCPGWDSNGSGCVSGCASACQILLSSWAFHDVQCTQATGQCQPSNASASTGSCGSYQYVTQCQ